MTTLDGRLFARGASASRPAVLSGTHERAILHAEGEEERRVCVASVSERLGKLPRRVTLSDGSVFECADGPALDTFLGTGSAGHRLSGFERSWRAVVAAAFLSYLLVAILVHYGVPFAAWAAARSTPQPYLDAIDTGALATADATILSPTKLSALRQSQLQTMFAGLLQSSGIGSDVELIFRSAAIGPNAFALPGGTVVLLDELVAVARSEDEIAGVLAHEIGHVALGHSLQSLYRALGLVFVVNLISGDTSQLVDHLASQAATLQSLRYSRAFETEADRYSVVVMRRAGRDPVAFVALLERIGKSMVGGETADGNDRDAMGKGGWWSTHPGNDDRRRDVEAFAREPLPAP